MKTTFQSVGIVAAVVCITTCQASFGANQAKVTFKTVDEDGKVLSGVSAEASFHLGVERKGVTDTNGLFVLEGESKGQGDTWYSFRKDGYYLSYGRHKLKLIRSGEYQPWNPVITAVVRRIISPIPMYAKKAEMKIPAKNTPLGFDLAQGDWVPPFGKGLRSDFVFSFSNRVSGLTDYEGRLYLAFSNALDGIIECREQYASSWFHMPRYAPDQGYQTNWCAYFGRDPKTGVFGDADVCGGGDHEPKFYFFRVRSKVDADGNLKESFYGKLAGQIRIQRLANPTPTLMFTYYMNPTPNDRNMECDIKQNLIRNLKSTEEVMEP